MSGGRPQSWLRCAGAVVGLQVVLGGLVYFVYDYPWLAAVLGTLLLPGILQAVRPLRDRPGWEATLCATTSQLPGLVGTANVALEQARLYTHSSLGDILDFVMETWHTPLLPWLRLLPDQLVHTASGEELAPFFLGLTALSPLLMAWTLAAARWRPRRRA